MMNLNGLVFKRVERKDRESVFGQLFVNDKLIISRRNTSIATLNDRKY